MKTDSFEKITSAIDEKTLDAVLSARGKKLNKLEEDKIKLFEETDQTETLVIEEAEEESRGERIRKGVFKALSVAAAIVLIAGIVYVVRIPLYMNGKEPTPAASDTQSTVITQNDPDESESDLIDTALEIQALSNRAVCFSLTQTGMRTWFDPDRQDKISLEDVKKIKDDMTFKEVVSLIGKPQHDYGRLCSMRIFWDIADSDQSYGINFVFKQGYDAEHLIVRDETTGPLTGEVPYKDDMEDDDFFTPRDTLTYVSTVKIGMTCEEMIKVTYPLSYSTGLPSVRGVSYYVNDKKTGHVFFISCDDGRVAEICDSGIPVYYIAPEEKRAEIRNGMDFDDVVDILGRPHYNPAPDNSSVLFRIGDVSTFFLLNFERKSSDPDSEDYDRYVVCNYNGRNNEISDSLRAFYESCRDRCNKISIPVSSENAAKIHVGMTFGEICSVLGDPVCDNGLEWIDMLWAVDTEEGTYLRATFTVHYGIELDSLYDLPAYDVYIGKIWTILGNPV